MKTYNDIEIIFFDDNSQDNSLEVIKEYKNIKTIENKKQTKFMNSAKNENLNTTHHT